MIFKNKIARRTTTTTELRTEVAKLRRLISQDYHACNSDRELSEWADTTRLQFDTLLDLVTPNVSAADRFEQLDALRSAACRIHTARRDKKAHYPEFCRMLSSVAILLNIEKLRDCKSINHEAKVMMFTNIFERMNSSPHLLDYIQAQMCQIINNEFDTSE
jgi:hypothetical protein